MNYNKKVYFTCFLIMVSFFAGCAGMNPNPGEKTADVAWIDGQYDKAVSILKPKAEEGYPWAQLRLCAAYKYGIGVEKNPSEAIKWCKKASVQMATGKWADGFLVGSIGKAGYFNQNSDALIAQYQLADFYHSGEGVNKDLITAYLYIKNVKEKTKGNSIFYCCEFADSRYITASQISNLNDKIVKEMTKEQLHYAEKQRLSWSPIKELQIKTKTPKIPALYITENFTQPVKIMINLEKNELVSVSFQFSLRNNKWKHLPNDLVKFQNILSQNLIDCGKIGQTVDMDETDYILLITPYSQRQSNLASMFNLLNIFTLGIFPPRFSHKIGLKVEVLSSNKSIKKFSYEENRSVWFTKLDKNLSETEEELYEQLRDAQKIIAKSFIADFQKILKK